jgi:hypothetical protein
MKLLKQALGVLGALVVLAVIVAFLAPKEAHALAAALVQIVPGTTTHVGQNESRLVSLRCLAEPGCFSLDPAGEISSPTLYVVPSGYTLIVTDWEWVYTDKGTPGNLVENQLVNASGGDLVFSLALIASGGGAFTHEHYESGIRVGSGATIEDFFAANGAGFGAIQGYLVPND